MKVPRSYVIDLIQEAFIEDKVSEDITSSSIFEPDHKINAVISIKQQGVLAGLDTAVMVFKIMDPQIWIKRKCSDGVYLKKGAKVLELKGSARSIFGAERTALNFLSHLSAIATLTREFVNQAKPAKIYDTRKTTAGLRLLEKYAVRVGGGHTHRMNLEEHFLIKDNHIAAYQIPDARCRKQKRTNYKGSKIAELVKKARKYKRSKVIEVEVETLAQFKEALDCDVDIIMLDNMKLADIKKAVELKRKKFRKGRPLIEVSGGITLKNTARIARTGADRIAIGALTHSAPAVDFSLEVQ